ncbi:MAG: MotA/TolQ/ExbB proton channel family protein [Bacteroidetes bacterium]|nr:MotA/TolQ/ExbB proton channel family protein [Bacteroidota bacterium]
MKKLIAFLTIAGMLVFVVSTTTFAQDEDAVVTDTTAVDTTVVVEVVQAESSATTLEDEVVEAKGFHQVLKEEFIAGNAMFMSFVLLALIFGLAICIERIIYLNLSTTNTRKLLNKVESAVETGGVEAAKEVCKDTRGPVASIFYQGLSRYDDGLEEVEKSIVAYGSVLMGRLESGLSWISLFIAIAPMLGFMGTVIGMISAFDNIEAVGDISPAVVAGGIKMALLTTVFGLIVAIILQIFYNYILSKVDGLVNAMEDSSISFIDILAKYKK